MSIEFCRSILMIEDDSDDVDVVRQWLIKSETPFELHVVSTPAAAESAISRNHVDLILLNLSLTKSQGLDSLNLLRAVVGDLPIIVFSGFEDRSLAISAVRNGAEDYVLKDEVTSPADLTRPIDLAIERRRRQCAERSLLSIESQMDLAHQIQMRLIPDAQEVFANIQWFGRCEPAGRSGGDFYDLIKLPDDALAFMIADVSGHGLVSAMIMMETRAVLRAMAITCDDPGTILTYANRILCRDIRMSHFVTLFFGILSPDRNGVCYASAGHPAYLLGDAAPPVTLASNSPPLGIVEDAIYETNQLPVALGSQTLLLFTDGLLDSISSDPAKQTFDYTVSRAVTRLAGPLVDVLSELFCNVDLDATDRDDCTALVLRNTVSTDRKEANVES